MSLLDEIHAAQPRIGGRCQFEMLIPALDDADRHDLLTALADPTITGTAISKALIARGHKVQPTTVQRHRRGGCGCESR